jgi:hypothetical protein
MVALTLVAAAIALVIASWPAIGRSQSQSQSQSRRDRSRRDFQTGPSSDRSGSGRPDSSNRSGSGKFDPRRRDASSQSNSTKADAARPGTSGQSGRITGPPEPNAAKAVERRPVRRAVQDEQWAKYDIILARNMFSRDRIPARVRDAREEPTKNMPNPESYFLLRGVTQEKENSQFIAFVEDKKSGSVLRLHQGDHVARGTVKSVNLDGLEYQLADKTTPVNLGYDLEGGRGAITASDLANYSQTAAPAAAQGSSAGQPAAPSANEAEILKRLMEQRKQQLGQ